MSLFGFGPRYSIKEHPITELEIKRLISHEHVMSLDSQNMSEIEPAIIARRHSDGKISLQQIYEVLTQLKNQNKISKQDREGVMGVFENFFKERFSN